MNLSPADRLRIRWRLALDGLEVRTSMSFYHANADTGRFYSVGVPDSGPCTVACDYMSRCIVWTGNLSRPRPLIMWDRDYKFDGDAWFDELEFRAAAKAAMAWVNEGRLEAGFVAPPGIRA